MTSFENFQAVHGPAIRCRPASEESILRYEGILPTVLLEHWREVGWCGYGDGLLWIVNPDDLREPLAELLGADAERSHAILRTALGGIVVWNENGAFYLDPNKGAVSSMINDIEILFFFMLCDPGYVDHVLGREIFQQALPRLGVLEHDECYGFVPAIALGGPGTPETLQRVKLREYLSILAQLGGGNLSL